MVVMKTITQEEKEVKAKRRETLSYKRGKERERGRIGGERSKKRERGCVHCVCVCVLLEAPSMAPK